VKDKNIILSKAFALLIFHSLLRGVINATKKTLYNKLNGLTTITERIFQKLYECSVIPILKVMLKRLSYKKNLLG